MCCGAERRVQPLAIHAPAHRPIPLLQPPSRSTQPLTFTPPHTLLWGVQHSGSAPKIPPGVQKSPQPSLQLISYMCSLITASLRLLAGSRREVEKLGHREALHTQPKAHPAERAAPLPHGMTRLDLAAQQLQLSRQGLICCPLQERTFVPSLQTQTRTEDAYYRTLLHELGFALQPSVTGVLGFPAFTQRGFARLQCTTAALFQSERLCWSSQRTSNHRSTPRQS